MKTTTRLPNGLPQINPARYLTDRMVKAYRDLYNGCSRETPRDNALIAWDLNHMGVRILRADYENRTGEDRYRKVNARDVCYADVCSGFACAWER